MIAFLCIVLISMVAAPLAHADEPELITDRPDFTESAVVVPRGDVQVEAGFTWERGADDVDVFSGPELLLRWGLARRIEVRVGIPDYISVGDPFDESGLGDSSIGAKVELGGESAWDVGVIVTASLPTGDDEFTSDKIDPGVIVTTGRSLSPLWSLGAQVQGEWPSVADDREFVWGGTVVVGRALGNRAGAFLEIAATVPDEGDAATVLHHGYTFAVTPLFQVDIHGGVGLSDTAPDTFAGAGLALRR